MIDLVALAAATRERILGVTVQAATFAAFVRTRIIAASTGYRALGASAYARRLALRTSQRLLAAAAQVGKFLVLFDATDAATIRDAIFRAFQKTREDAVSALEEVAKATTKTREDAAVTNDASTRTVEKVRADSVSATHDIPTKSFSKVLTEAPRVAEQVTREFTKALADTSAIGDAFSRIFNAVRSFNDGTSASDVMQREYAKTKADQASTSDGGLVTSQSYVERGFLMEDYTGVSRTF